MTITRPHPGQLLSSSRWWPWHVEQACGRSMETTAREDTRIRLPAHEPLQSSNDRMLVYKEEPEAVMGIK